MIFEKIRERLQELKTYKLDLVDTMCELMKKDRLDNYISREEAIDIINQVEAEYINGWIDIKTKLPKYDEYVLCQGKNSQFIACIDSLDNKWKDGHFYVRTNITHWQPLPQPPKGE